jgi:hypothetical protein
MGNENENRLYGEGGMRMTEGMTLINSRDVNMDPSAIFDLANNMTKGLCCKRF